MIDLAGHATRGSQVQSDGTSAINRAEGRRMSNCPRRENETQFLNDLVARDRLEVFMLKISVLLT